MNGILQKINEILRYVYSAYAGIGRILGWINTRILLCLVFFFMITPMGVILKLLGKDPLSRKWDEKAETYRIKVIPKDLKHMEMPF